MAIQVMFEGRVGEAKEFSWGTVLKVSHAQRAKNKDSGEWETVGYDNFDVVLPDGIDYRDYPEKSIVAITGSLRKVETYAKRDGTTGVSMKVRAIVIEPVDRKGNYTSKTDDLPF
jgi:hypothetical protein